jgi:hypothetical protein
MFCGIVDTFDSGYQEFDCVFQGKEETEVCLLISVESEAHIITLRLVTS